MIPEFYSFVDTDKKYEEVVREVNALRPTLPPEISELDDPEGQSRAREHRAVRAGVARTRRTASSKTTRAT